MIILEKHPVSGYEPRHYRREPSGSVGVGEVYPRAQAATLRLWLVPNSALHVFSPGVEYSSYE